MTTLLDAPPRPAAATQSAIRSTLVQRAMEALLAAQTRTDAGQLQIEERAVYRPDSWLIQQCWEALADAGAATEALTVARLAAPRQPLTLVQTLYRLSQQIDRKLGLANLIGQELTRIQPEVLAPTAARDDVTARDRLLFAAATAATSAMHNWHSPSWSGSTNLPRRGNARSSHRNSARCWPTRGCG
jgi:hypothetical protein